MLVAAGHGVRELLDRIGPLRGRQRFRDRNPPAREIADRLGNQAAAVALLENEVTVHWSPVPRNHHR